MFSYTFEQLRRQLTSATGWQDPKPMRSEPGHHKCMGANYNPAKPSNSPVRQVKIMHLSSGCSAQRTSYWVRCCRLGGVLPAPGLGRLTGFAADLYSHRLHLLADWMFLPLNSCFPPDYVHMCNWSIVSGARVLLNPVLRSLLDWICSWSCRRFAAW